ncbi:hypothetical protein [Luteimonas vadosa]
MRAIRLLASGASLTAGVESRLIGVPGQVASITASLYSRQS